MTLHVLVEGPSERAFLEAWSKRLLKGRKVRVHPHQGKGRLPKRFDAKPNANHRGLLDQLPAKLRGFAAASDPDFEGVLVLLDLDDDVQEELLRAIESVIVAAGVNCVVAFAVEETEAFYLGDLKALDTAYPDADMNEARKYVPDSIVGTWELFGKIIGDGGGNKVQWAERMGAHVTTLPARTRSASFKALIGKLKSLARPLNAGKPKRKKYRHPLRPTDSSRRR